jgi:hypothetical protein
MLTVSSSPVQLKNTRAIATYLQRGFRANHFQWQEKAGAKKTRATSGRRPSNVYAIYDQDTRSWKTSQVCLIAATSPKFSGRWPKQGLMRDGLCSEQTMWERRTEGKDSGYWPTPDTQNHRDGSKLRKDNNLAQGGRHGVSLHHAVWKWPTPTAMTGGQGVAPSHKDGGHGWNIGAAVQDSLSDDPARMWPTPRAQDSKHGPATEWELTTDHAGTKDSLRVHVAKRGMWPTPRASEWKGVGPIGSKSHQYRLDRKYLDATVQEAEQRTGRLNPTWVESHLMGWPIGWTDLKPLEMDKFHEWLQSHGAY